MLTAILAHVALAQVPTATTTAAATATAGATPAAAVERFSFDAAVARALARNPTMTSAKADVMRAEALVREARASALPVLSGNATYTHLDSARGQPPGSALGQDELAANLMLNLPLLAPLPWTSWSHAEDARVATEASAQDIRRQVAVAVGRAYLTVIAQHRILEVTARARDNAQAHYQYAHTRFAGGVGHSIDEIRAAQELATDEGQLERARVALVRAQEALGVLAGADAPIDTTDQIELAPPPPETEAVEAARTTRADVRASAARLDASERARRDLWAYFLPTLTGVFEPFYQHPATVLAPHTGWQAELILSLPLYDGGYRYGVRDEREASVIDAAARMEGAVRQAEAEVRTAFEAARRTAQALEDAARAARLAREALKLATLAYKAGAATNIEVIDAERQARDAETQVAIAEDAARQSRLDLLAASGRFPG